jgi:hypothetical protein
MIILELHKLKSTMIWNATSKLVLNSSYLANFVGSVSWFPQIEAEGKAYIELKFNSAPVIPRGGMQSHQ